METLMRLPTYSGLEFNPIGATPEMLSIKDIAHGLSQICRYSGQCPKFYSVAEHSYLMAWYAENILEKKYLAFACLMHDASEAYIADMPAYIKHLLPNYQWIEENLANAINEKFGVKAARYERSVKKLDYSMLKTEMADMFPAVRPNEGNRFLDNYDVLPMAIFNFAPVLAERKFLETYERLKP